jgi:hypothetical protein
MSPLERETKLVVSAQDYLSVLESGRLLERRDQLNIYIDDPARLAETSGYFRARFESESEPLATLKIAVGWKGDMREMIEVERPLSDFGPSLFPRPKRWIAVDELAPEGFLEHFQGLGVARLRRLGWMRNLRCVIELGPGRRIELDRTVLPGGEVSYEVEIESPHEQIHSVCVEQVRALAPSAEFSRMGKYSRFLLAAGLVSADRLEV